MSNFMKFWKALNANQQAQGLADILYGDARRLFDFSGLPN